jgi:hypothetical protein
MAFYFGKIWREGIKNGTTVLLKYPDSSNTAFPSSLILRHVSICFILSRIFVSILIKFKRFRKISSTAYSARIIALLFSTLVFRQKRDRMSICLRLYEKSCSWCKDTCEWVDTIHQQPKEMKYIEIHINAGYRAVVQSDNIFSSTLQLKIHGWNIWTSVNHLLKVPIGHRAMESIIPRSSYLS